MKKLLSIVLMMLMICLMIGCDIQENSYRKKVPSYTQAVMEDNHTDVEIVSSVRSYKTLELENPDHYALTGTGIARSVYMENGLLCVPTGNYDYYGEAGISVLQYDMAGELVGIEYIPISSDSADQSICFPIETYLLSDGTYLYYGASDPERKNGSISILDENQNVLYRTALSTYDYVFTITYRTSPVIHVNERPDGTVRILVNAFDKLYYLDEKLNILQSIEIAAEYEGIYMESDGVYILGNQMPQMARADMNAGTVDRIETQPVPAGWTYDCKFQYGGDGKLYCERDGAIYQCDGNGNVTEVLRWDRGAYDGEGQYWILNENAIYFMPMSGAQMVTSYNTLVLLQSEGKEEVLDRRLITLANLSQQNNEWLRSVIDMFNNGNEDYYIEYLDFTDTVDGSAAFDAHLLSEGTPDIVIFENQNQSRDYTDKALFVDFAPHYKEALLGCAVSAYTLADGTLPLLPLSMQANTYAAATAVQGDALSWEELRAHLEALSTGAVISYDNLLYLYRMSLSDFFDDHTKENTFDSLAFMERIQLLEALQTEGLVVDYGALKRSFSTGFQYGVSGGVQIVDAIRSGEVRLLYVPFQTPEAYAALKQVFGDVPFTLCGYPTLTGDAPGVTVKSDNLLAVFADSDTLGGCRVFIDYLLSDEVQSAEYLCVDALPVTYSGLAAALENYRYLYYPAEHTVTEQDGFGHSNPYVSLEATHHSAMRDEGYLTQKLEREVVLTDDDIRAVLAFFDSCSATADTDDKIAQIADEELSAYKGDAVSLEDTVKRIASRVRIYLNE